MMKYGILEGLLLCGCMLQAFGSEGVSMGKDSIENATSPQSSASISTSSEEQAQYPTSMTFTAENIGDFYKLKRKAARKLESVTFKGVDIDQNFVGQFITAFQNGGLEWITFDGCNLKDGEEYNDLFCCGYDVANLTINDENITNNDAIGVYCLLNQLGMGDVRFLGKKLDREFIMNELSLCDANPRTHLFINE